MWQGRGGLQYRPALDGIRAVAIAAVVGYHAFGWPGNGGLGVDLFFVLSGFLITTLLLEERRLTGAVSITRFWRRRVYRLVPALVVMLAVVSAVLAAAGELDRHALSGVVAGLAYVMNLGFFEDVPLALTPLWSLALEEQFYLVWPPVFIVLLRGRVKLGLAIVLAATAASFAQGWRMSEHADGSGRLWDWPDTRGLPILIGCAAALLLVLRPRIGRFCGWLLAPALIWVCASTLFQPSPLDHTFRGPLLSFSVTCAILVMGAYDGRGPVSWLLATPPLRFCGRISYSLYLWHMPVIVAAAAILGDHASTEWIAVAAAVAVATLSFYVVERPVRQWGRKRAAPDPETGRPLPAPAVA
jgi:peptidoglycan/LPS O-acetylase OafA/YrhL